MRYEFAKSAIHAEYARRAFVALLTRELPHSVFVELNSLPATQEAVEAWATTHGINAPCVTEAFGLYANGGWERYQRFHGSASGWADPRPPDEWHAAINAMNASRVYVPLQLTNLDEVFRRHLEGDPAWPADAPYVVQAIAERQGPLGADPTQESWEEFQERARQHYDARVLTVKALGGTMSRPESKWKNIARDQAWLFRYQFLRESLDDIVGTPDAEDATRVKVEQAITRMAALIGLERPRGMAARLARKPR